MFLARYQLDHQLQMLKTLRLMVSDFILVQFIDTHWYLC